jgi:hypothetical protein
MAFDFNTFGSTAQKPPQTKVTGGSFDFDSFGTTTPFETYTQPKPAGPDLGGEIADMFHQSMELGQSGIDDITTPRGNFFDAAAGGLKGALKTEAAIAGVAFAPFAPIINRTFVPAMDAVQRGLANTKPFQEYGAASPYNSDKLPFESIFENLANAGMVSMGILGAKGAGGAKTGLTKLKEAAPAPEPSQGGFFENAARNSIKSDVQGLLNATRSNAVKTERASNRGVDFQAILEDPQVFRGLRVDNAKIIPDEAVQTLQDRVDILLDAKKRMLPKIDSLVPDHTKTALFARARQELEGKMLLADEKAAIGRLEKLLDAEPETFNTSYLDSIRAKARQSARDAKGQMKSDSEYAALETAARDTLFDTTDNLPIAGAEQYKALNDYVKQMIAAKDFLDVSVRGQTVKGGRLGGYAMRAIGAVAGSHYGPLGSVGGSIIGGLVNDVLVNNTLGSSLKMNLIRSITDDPAILAQAEKLAGDLHQLNAPLLPPGRPNTGVNGGRPIIAGEAGPREYVGPDVRIGNYQRLPNSARPTNQAPTNAPINTIHSINDIVPPQAMKSIQDHFASAEMIMKELPKGEFNKLGGVPGLLERTRTNMADGLQAQGLKGLAEHIRSFDLTPFKSFEAFKEALWNYIKNIQPGLSMKRVNPFDDFTPHQQAFLIKAGDKLPNLGVQEWAMLQEVFKSKGYRPPTTQLKAKTMLKDIFKSTSRFREETKQAAFDETADVGLELNRPPISPQMDGAHTKPNFSGKDQAYDPETGRWQATTASKPSKVADTSIGSELSGRRDGSALKVDTYGPFDGNVPTTPKLYHATTEDYATNIRNLGLRGDQKKMYFASNKDITTQYGKGVVEIDPTDLKVLDAGSAAGKRILQDAGIDPDFPHINDRLNTTLKENGYDGIKYQTSKDNFDYELVASEKLNAKLKGQSSPSIPKELEALPTQQIKDAIKSGDSQAIDRLIKDAPTKTISADSFAFSDDINAAPTNKITFDKSAESHSISYWKDKISKGERPAILLRKNGNGFNVWDGNHRVAAYKALGIKDIPVVYTDAVTDFFNKIKGNNK